MKLKFLLFVSSFLSMKWLKSFFVYARYINKQKIEKAPYRVVVFVTGAMYNL